MSLWTFSGIPIAILKKNSLLKPHSNLLILILETGQVPSFSVILAHLSEEISPLLPRVHNFIIKSMRNINKIFLFIIFRKQPFPIWHCRFRIEENHKLSSCFSPDGKRIGEWDSSGNSFWWMEIQQGPFQVIEKNMSISCKNVSFKLFFSTLQVGD
jgi:hypothetical protein